MSARISSCLTTGWYIPSNGNLHPGEENTFPRDGMKGAKLMVSGGFLRGLSSNAVADGRM